MAKPERRQPAQLPHAVAAGLGLCCRPLLGGQAAIHDKCKRALIKRCIINNFIA